MPQVCFNKLTYLLLNKYFVVFVSPCRSCIFLNSVNWNKCIGRNSTGRWTSLVDHADLLVGRVSAIRSVERERLGWRLRVLGVGDVALATVWIHFEHLPTFELLLASVHRATFHDHFHRFAHCITRPPKQSQKQTTMHYLDFLHLTHSEDGKFRDHISPSERQMSNIHYSYSLFDANSSINANNAGSVRAVMTARYFDHVSSISPHFY